MDIVNQKIIQAVIDKANKVCPDSLLLIGIYGSVATGDAYEKSDLDLLILIGDDEGWKLGTGFILDDRKERPGVKFKDADLLGIPIRITVGRGAADGIIEYKMRREADKVELPVEEGIAKAIEIVNAEKDGRHFFKK